MKKSLITIAILSTLISSIANATESVLSNDSSSSDQTPAQTFTAAQNFQWIGGSIGISNRNIANQSTPVTPVTGLIFNGQANNSTVEPNFNLNYTQGVVFADQLNSKNASFGAAAEANLLLINSHLIPLFKMDGVVVLPNETLIFMPNIGYSVRTGGVYGLDALHPICNNNDCSISLKVGLTKFNKSVGGATFVANVGIVKSF